MYADLSNSRAAPRSRVSAPPFVHRFDIAMLSGASMALVLTLPRALQVVSDGTFLNPDDAMRAVEVRDFMAGQAWFDLVPHRLSPDHSFSMHWSRIVDLPLALMGWGFGCVLPPADAELAMRLTAPCLLFAAALWALLSLVRNLIGPRALLPAALLLGGSTELVSNFIPGHIHHHAAQATLLLLATKLLLDALAAPERWRSAVGVGVLSAVSLGIGLQNLPFVAGIGAVAGLGWMVRGPAGASLLAGFGGGLAAAGCVVFAVDVPPVLYGEGACDAFSTAHLLLASLGGALCLVLAGVSVRLPQAWARLLAGGASALLLIVALRLCYPACLHDPMAGVDPLLRAQWLAYVGEALPLAQLVATDWLSGMPLVLTLIGGLAATLAAAVYDRRNRAAWGALLLLSTIGCVGTLYQVRVAASTCACLVPGLAWSMLRVFDIVHRHPKRPALLAATLVGLLGNGAGWSALAEADARVLTPPRSRIGRGNDVASCWSPRAYDGLKALPTGLVLSTIDPGPQILAATSHSVLAAPYHRNSYGNRVALLAFAATPEAARPIVSESRATYIALCTSSNEAADVAAHDPDSLAATLLDGRVPDWLDRIGTGHEHILLFSVKTHQ